MDLTDPELQQEILDFAHTLSEESEEDFFEDAHEALVAYIIVLIRKAFARRGETQRGHQLCRSFREAGLGAQVQFLEEKLGLPRGGLSEWVASHVRRHLRMSFRPPPADPEEPAPPTVVAIPGPPRAPENK